MHQKKYIQFDAEGICFHELEYSGAKPPRAGPELMDVTSRTDGPWLGKRYDRQADAFSWPRPTAKLTASSSSIAQGGKVTLSWETTHALSAEISVVGGALIHRCEPVHAGQFEVQPAQTTTYELKAVGHPGTTPATQRRRVRVT